MKHPLSCLNWKQMGPGPRPKCSCTDEREAVLTCSQSHREINTNIQKTFRGFIHHWVPLHNIYIYTYRSRCFKDKTVKHTWGAAYHAHVIIHASIVPSGQIGVSFQRAIEGHLRRVYILQSHTLAYYPFHKQTHSCLPCRDWLIHKKRSLASPVLL